jgi:hypothetical protein
VQDYEKLVCTPEASKHNEKEQEHRQGPNVRQTRIACSFDECSESFSHARNFRRHMSMHGSPVYRCPLSGCNRTFYRAGKLRSHLKQGHFPGTEEKLSQVAQMHDEPWSQFALRRAADAQLHYSPPRLPCHVENGEEEDHSATPTAHLLVPMRSHDDSGYGASIDAPSPPDVGSHWPAHGYSARTCDNVSNRPLHLDAACSTSIVENVAESQNLCHFKGCQQKYGRASKYLLCIEHSFEWPHLDDLEEDSICRDYNPAASEFNCRQLVDGHGSTPHLNMFEQQANPSGTAVEECGNEFVNVLEHSKSQGRDEEWDTTDILVTGKVLKSEAKFCNPKPDPIHQDAHMNPSSLSVSNSDASASPYSDDTDEESQEHHSWEDGFVSNSSLSTCTDEKRTTVVASSCGFGRSKDKAESAETWGHDYGCQETQDAGESSKTAGKRKATSVTGFTSSRTSKRARRESGDDDEPDGDGNGKDRKPPGTRQAKYIPRNGEISKGKFACPFAKQDPMNHIECWTFAQSEPGHVK